MSRSDLLADEPFIYHSSRDGVVRISYRGKTVTTLKGRESSRFLSRMEAADRGDAQVLMAKATGHFKHGTERAAREERE